VALLLGVPNPSVRVGDEDPVAAAAAAVMH